MKAVIMAGGSGKRLRPMTSTTPKPMVKLFSKPVLQYTLDLLGANSFDDVTLTLGYMAERIEDFVFNDCGGKNKITVLKESEPLGTAGSVKNASKNFSEPFLVISGDCICDFDLKSIMDFHISKNADVTIVCTRTQDPREYGVIEFDDSDKVNAFTEKPQWSGAVSDCINTGIYIINPQIMSYVPENTFFDFSKDLFPKILADGKQVLCYSADGYWCDIGSIKAYKQCCNDIMDKKVSVKLPQVAEGIYVKDEMPKGNYNVIPPCYIGSGVTIGNNAVIGPYTCLGDGCFIGENSKIRQSHLLSLCRVQKNCVINDAVICENTVVKTGARIYENSVVGASSTVNQNAVIGSNITIWPEKTVERGADISRDIKYSETASKIFADVGISGTSGVEIDPVSASVIGQALASSSVGKKIGIATDGRILSKSTAYSVIGALTAHGSHVRNFGESFYSQLKFYVLFCGLEAGIFISERNSEIRINICGEGGLPLETYVQRDIENRIKYREFSRCSPLSCRDVSDMTGVGLMYRRELIRQSESELSGISCLVKSGNEKILMLMEDCLYRLGCRQGDEITFKISSDGSSVSAFHRGCGWVTHDKLLGICVNYETENGRDVAVPFNAPHIFDAIAEKNGRRVLRYYMSAQNADDTEARALSSSQLFMRDALFTAVKILGIIDQTGKNLPRLLRDLPSFFVSRKQIKIDFLPSMLTKKCGGENYEVTREGILLKYPYGSVLVTPSRTGKILSLISEANSYEISKELCRQAEELLEK